MFQKVTPQGPSINYVVRWEVQTSLILDYDFSWGVGPPHAEKKNGVKIHFGAKKHMLQSDPIFADHYELVEKRSN